MNGENIKCYSIIKEISLKDLHIVAECVEKRKELRSLYYDRKNHVKYFSLWEGTNLSIITFKEECNDEDIQFSRDFQCEMSETDSIIGHCTFLNRIYLITRDMNYSPSAYIFDMTLKKKFEISLESDSSSSENPVELGKYNSIVFIESKILFIGGLCKTGKLMNTVSSFDIGTYKFSNEKVRENNMIPRYRHGSMESGGIIYIIGGYTTVEEKKESICEIVQIIKYDNLMNTWLCPRIEGQPPMGMIDPIVQMINDQYIVAYSAYKYPHMWVLNMTTSNGVMYDFSDAGNSLMSTSSITCEEDSIISVYSIDGTGTSIRRIKVNQN